MFYQRPQTIEEAIDQYQQEVKQLVNKMEYNYQNCINSDENISDKLLELYQKIDALKLIQNPKNNVLPKLKLGPQTN